MTYLMLAIALLLSGIAAYYSIAGLVAIFAAAVTPIIVMGSALEAAKLVIASWLYRNWKAIPLLMKSYFTIALVILMSLTSMGIFGFLSKAHMDQSLVSGDVMAKVSVYDEKLKIAKENIQGLRNELKQLDAAVDQVMARSTSEAGADKSNAIRKAQQRDRVRIAKEIETNQKLVSSINEESAPIRAEVRKVEAEVGPIKYIAALIYGDNATDATTLESAVRIVILLIVAVFDPLAVLMLIAVNRDLKNSKDYVPVQEVQESQPKKSLLSENQKLLLSKFNQHLQNKWLLLKSHLPKRKQPQNQSDK